MPLKAILFDMDGVLFDSMPYHAQAWHDAMTHFGFHLSCAEAYANEGRTGSSTINNIYRRELGRDATAQEIVDLYAYKSNLFKQYPMPVPIEGAYDALCAIKAMGLSIALVTGSALDGLEARLERHFPGIFRRDHMVTAYDVVQGKPHPEPYLKGLAKVSAAASEVLVVENAPLGIQAACAAGITTLAINTGPLADSLLFEAGAHMVFPRQDGFAQITNHIQSLCKTSPQTSQPTRSKPV